MEDYEPEEPWSDPDLIWEREREEIEYERKIEEEKVNGRQS